MAFGLDYVTGPPIADMKAAGVSFVCRYLSYVNNLTQVKLLTPAEAKGLSAAGIAIVSNYEWYANRALEGAASGVQDAHIAASQHAACGGPASRPIYFSVDVDVDGAQVGDYFKGIASVIGKGRTGAYGSYRVLKYLFDNGLITWGWQTYAWSAGLWEPRAHIQQYLNGVSMSGHSVDYNRSMHIDFGQWSIGGGGIMIDLSTPGVANYFTSNAPGWWQCKNGKQIHGEILQTYQEAGNSGLNGLTWWGLPKSNEIPVESYPGFQYLAGQHITIQFFERAVVAFDPDHKLDNPPGAGRVYPVHLYSGPGQDPVIATLQQELAQAQKATPTVTGVDQAKVANRLQAIGLASHNGDAAIQNLVSQAIV